MPYRSNDSKRRKKAQLGVGWSLWKTASPPPIPELVLDGIPGFLAWFAFLFSIFSAFVFPRTLLLIATVLAVYMAIRFLMAGISNFMGLKEIDEWETRDWKDHYDANQSDESLAWDDVHHLVIIPNYNEPIVILRRTLNALKEQYQADKRITIILAMEATEEGCVEKAKILEKEFLHYFKNFYFTVHPSGLPNEMQCKSANEAWAARWAKRKLVDKLSYNIDHICVTAMDADTRWHPQHFFALTALFALDDNRYMRFWQAPMRYHGNIWEINPLLRIVNAYATAFELSYLASPWWLAMPMSSYALSLRLLDMSGYWDGDVIADEWHMFIKAYFARGGDVSLKEIMLPFMADATIGNNLLDELTERYRQTLRHAWGSKEVGYMIAKMMEHPEVEFRPSLRLLMRISHDILLAGAGWIILTVGSQLPVLLHPEIAPFNPIEIMQNPEQASTLIISGFLANPVWLLLAVASIFIIILAIVFLYLDITVRPPRTKPQTMMERFWTILSIPLMPLLTVIVLAIPAIVAQTRLLLGKPLKFRVSKKI